LGPPISPAIMNDLFLPFRRGEGAWPFAQPWSIPIAGASGLWMTYRMDLWHRFADLHFWWMSAMAGLWLVFALMVFVLELLLHPRFEAEGRRDPIALLRRMSRAHAVLLAIAAVTVQPSVPQHITNGG
jgi:hypothetical protein